MRRRSTRPTSPLRQLRRTRRAVARALALAPSTEARHELLALQTRL